MKRIYIAFLLLAAVTVASVFELFYVRDTADEFIEKIESINTLVNEKSSVEANKKVSALAKDWSKTVERIDVLLIHDYVDSIGLDIARMKAALMRNNADMYFSESESAKKGLASIKESEYPNLENIL